MMTRCVAVRMTRAYLRSDRCAEGSALASYVIRSNILYLLCGSKPCTLEYTPYNFVMTVQYDVHQLRTSYLSCYQYDARKLTFGVLAAVAIEFIVHIGLHDVVIAILLAFCTILSMQAPTCWKYGRAAKTAHRFRYLTSISYLLKEVQDLLRYQPPLSKFLVLIAS